MNIRKTKSLICKPDKTISQVVKSRYPCGVCRKGVGRNSIFCSSCQQWIHHRCTNLSNLRPDPHFKCRRCDGQVVTEDSLSSAVNIGDEALEAVESFCYLGDVMDCTGGCFGATTARIKAAWKTFRELLPVLTSRSINLRRRGYIYRAGVRSVLLYASETWAMRVEDLHRLERNENSMIRWMCSVKLSDRKSMAELREALGIIELKIVLQSNRLRWFGHLERMPNCKWPKKILFQKITGRNIRGGQKKKWIHNVNKDLRELRLDPRTAQDRGVWRSAIRKLNRHDIQSNPQT